MNCKKCGFIFCMADHPSGDYECGDEDGFVQTGNGTVAQRLQELEEEE